MNGRYKSTPPTYANDELVPELLTDVSGNVNVTEATLASGEDQANDVMKVEQQFVYTNITSATTTTVKSGAGFLHAIAINLAVAAGVITLYDNTAGSGTKIGTITFPTPLLANQTVMVYNVKFTTGLTIVTSASTDLTISTRA